MEGAAAISAAAASKVTALTHGEPLGADGYSGQQAGGVGMAVKAMTTPPACWLLWVGGGFEGGPTYYRKQRASNENGDKGGGRAERSAGSPLWGRTGAAVALGTLRKSEARAFRWEPKDKIKGSRLTGRTGAA